MKPTTHALALLADLEAALERQRTAIAGMAHATARFTQTAARAQQLAGTPLALLQEATD
ncbi:MAG: hypothetical protein ACK41W_09775 [Cyanobacteriota bacterium]